MPRRTLPSLLVFAGVAVAATAVITWAVADVLYEIALPRCVSGRRVVSCGGDHGWHDTSSWVSAVLAVPMLLTLVGTYLCLSSRLVRAEKAKRREALRSALRRRSALVLAGAVAVTVPVTMLVRSLL
ncbi:hypothetical protein [Couchioplanes azureus]|uniref:hypothetical protein n=1 Tax=Couchioplanes caeruleus TaxID=56438 RepID=UPI0016712FEE|nr:hypothetical protein [Couchioplanes caeruleus]GGQ85625.1 hypothetical protein GCM10010166_64970 [Couchioplanes caeruleus subsp. azureus]